MHMYTVAQRIKFFFKDQRVPIWYGFWWNYWTVFFLNDAVTVHGERYRTMARLE